MTNSVWGSFGANVPTREVFATETFAILRALTAPRSNANVTIEVDGGVTKGDGLGGIFYYDPNSVLADDGIDVIAPVNGVGRWRRSISNLGIALTAGAVLFGAAGNTFGQDVVNFSWDDANNRLTVSEVVTSLIGTRSASGLTLQVNGTPRWNIDNAAGTLYPQLNNVQSLGGPSNNIVTGYFGVSVVTPVVGTSVASTPFGLQMGGAVRWNIDSGANLVPAFDNVENVGSATVRIQNVFTPVIDSGTTGGFTIKLNNGEAVADFIRAGGVVANRWTFQGGSSGGNGVGMFPTGGDTNISPTFFSRGTGSIVFSTNVGSPSTQLSILDTASANRNATITGAVSPNNVIIGANAGGVAIVGTTTNDNAATGQYGEFVSATVVSGSAVALTSGVASNITSITLGAGDWDVSGVVAYAFGATTSYTNLGGGSSSNTGAFGSFGSSFDYETAANVPTAGSDSVWSIPTFRYSLSASTTIFLVAAGNFTVSTLKAYGTIRARRVR